MNLEYEVEIINICNLTYEFLPKNTWNAWSYKCTLPIYMLNFLILVTPDFSLNH